MRFHRGRALSSRARFGASAGFTLIELLVVMIVLTVATGMLCGTMVSSARQTRTKRDMAVASEAGRRMLELLRSQPFSEIFARYNADPSDDPGGAGTAPGRNFDAQGLEVQESDADGHVGSIAFPTVGMQLREDVTDLQLGMPRDLDGDGAVDTSNHASNYILLPVEVRIEWRGMSGDVSLRMHSQFVSL
jgi:prepilin-type N-terminal cleavage/methylation domain-containing protein